MCNTAYSIPSTNIAIPISFNMKIKSTKKKYFCFFFYFIYRIVNFKIIQANEKLNCVCPDFDISLSN